MKTTDTTRIIEQTDCLPLDSFHQLDSVVQMDSTEFVAIVECDSNATISPLNKENSWRQIPVSAIVSIVIFVLGWMFTRLFKRIDEGFARKRYREAVLKWIDLIMPTEYKLIDSIKKLSKAVSDSDDMRPEPFQMLNTIPDKIKDLSVESMMDSFGRGCDKKLRNRHLYNIISQFDYLTKMNREIVKEYERYNGQMLSLCKDWGGYYQRLVSAVEQSSKEIKDIFMDWMNEFNSGKTNASFSLNLAYIERIEQIPSAEEEILNLSLNMKQVIMQCIANNKGFAENFNNMANSVESSIKVLKEASDYFQEN